MGGKGPRHVSAELSSYILTVMPITIVSGTPIISSPRPPPPGGTMDHFVSSCSALCLTQPKWEPWAGPSPSCQLTVMINELLQASCLSLRCSTSRERVLNGGHPSPLPVSPASSLRKHFPGNPVHQPYTGWVQRHIPWYCWATGRGLEAAGSEAARC